MIREIYKFYFAGCVSMRDVELSLYLAVTAVEAIHGEAAVKLDGRFRLDKRRCVCIIDAETQVGIDIARVLTRFLSQMLDDRHYRIARVDSRDFCGDIVDLLRKVGSCRR